MPPGVATGLAWTEAGGDVLYIEATLLPGSRGLKLTGQLGEVMKESASIARSLMMAQAAAIRHRPADCPAQRRSRSRSGRGGAEGRPERRRRDGDGTRIACSRTRRPGRTRR